MANILIFAREIAPYCNSVGSSLRVITLGKHLQDAGHSVRILGAKGYYVSDFGLNSILNSLKIIYLNDFLQRYYTKKALNNTPDKEKKPSIKGSKESNFKWLKKSKDFVITGLKKIAIPDMAVFFLPKFIFHSLKIIKDNNIEVFIVSSPPHSSQIVGLFVKKFSRRKLEVIVDYRDGWNTFELFRPKYKLGQILSKYIERKVLISCDQFLYQSSKVLVDVVAEFNLRGLIESKSTLVRNGFTDAVCMSGQLSEYQEILAENSNSIKLGYFGGIDFNNGSWRNPSKYLDAIDSIGLQFQLTIYGQVASLSTVPTYRNIKILHKGLLDLPLAKQAMSGFDALFVFHSSDTGSDEVIPGKFYEYIQACRPIVVCGPPFMECGLLVEEYNFGIFIRSNASQEEVGRLARCLLDKNKYNGFIEALKSGMHEFSRDTQYSRIKFKHH